MVSGDTIHDGVLARVLRAPFGWMLSVGLYLVGMLLVAWTVNWIWVVHVWMDGVAGLHRLLAQELHVGTSFALQQGIPQSWITAPANVLYGFLFEATGIHEMGERFAQGAALSIPDTIARGSYFARHQMVEVAMLGTQLLGVRLAVLALFAPLSLALYAVGVAEGWSQRAIRKVRGGRESASLYHRAKYMQVVLLGLGISVMLVLPTPVDWGMCAGLGTVGVAILAAMQWAYYKKHM